MKTMFTMVVALLVSGLVMAQPPKGTATKGNTYGDKITATGAIDVNKLEKKVNAKKETSVKVKGKVVEVCTKMGCWIKMETADGNMMVKMKDHSFFVPLDLNGKEIIVEGLAKMTVTPVDELKHYLEDAGKSKAEIDAVKKPKKEIVIDASGILVL